MEVLLGKITQNAVNYAIRSGIAITSTYAMRQCTRLLQTVDNKAEYQELQILQERLDSKIKIISPAIDMIELISARGNNSLESAVTLTKSLRWEIQSLGTRIAKAASVEESSRHAGSKSRTQATHEAELLGIILDIKRLLIRIDDAVPLINLAITTSGATLSSTLPASVSTSRLLQGSAFLNDGDSRYAKEPNTDHQVGPVFTLSVYMLFSGNVRRSHLQDEEGTRDTTWKEAIHKARVRLLRVPLTDNYDNFTQSTNSQVLPSIESNYMQPHLLDGGGKANEYSYVLEIIEDLDDDRVHSFDDDEPQPGPYKDVQLAGIRERIPIYEVEKIFYADTGKILNINTDGETNDPVLLLRRNLNAPSPRRAMENNQQDYDYEPIVEPEVVQSDTEDGHDESQYFIDEQLRREATPAIDEFSAESSPVENSDWRFPANLDLEWVAFEVYEEAEDDYSEDEDQETSLNGDSTYESKLPNPTTRTADDPNSLASGLSHLKIDSPSPRSLSNIPSRPSVNSSFGAIKTNLSLLEVLIRLTSLQQFEQASHLTIHDETLNFFLEETSSTGKAASLDRKRARYDAARKVGFDPYDESPIKRHGAEYQQKHQGQSDYDGRGESQDLYSREGTPIRERWDDRSSVSGHGGAYSPNISKAARDEPRSRSGTPQKKPPESWLLRNRENGLQSLPSSPLSPLHQARKGVPGNLKPLEKKQLERRAMVDPEKRDSGLGISPEYVNHAKEL